MKREDRIRARSAQRTQGDWFVTSGVDENGDTHIYVVCGGYVNDGEPDMVVDVAISQEHTLDAEFIANAPMDIDYLLKENQRLQPHNSVKQVDELLALGVEMRRDIQRLRDAIEHIREYWNQDENEGAMADALWHTIETCDEALAPQEKTTR